jgi:hypothetical protein
MTPVVTLMSGAALNVLAVDETKAPAFRDRFERAWQALDARELIKVVDECIELGVPLKVDPVGTNASPWWTTIRNHAVQAVSAS